MINSGTVIFSLISFLLNPRQIWQWIGVTVVFGLKGIWTHLESVAAARWIRVLVDATVVLREDDFLKRYIHPVDFCPFDSRTFKGHLDRQRLVFSGLLYFVG